MPAQAAEAAFSDVSILADPRFPPQHKLAIYFPFFLPALLPLFVVLLKVIRLVWCHRHQL